ncbi:Uncharacterized protein conserved in bacteria [Klebsiella pneumoniae]|uniref:Uncharacterized protein conserved in bacteria n=1 Tax=Klebsiella pneumoniae TaxID=573 RepID=A0A2X3EQF5_KLEPN|nr:Uncharacterized protein conserved in bacteria [Klebsiella pneumoniae]
MFDVLMYLFETYIHSEAEMRVDQDKLDAGSYRCGFLSGKTSITR